MSACTACGACCASFRVDFSVFEREDHAGAVPTGLALDLTDTLCRMRGTDHSPPRCGALIGPIGQQAICGIYEWRPSPCREFEEGSDACEQARRRHHLPPLNAS